MLYVIVWKSLKFKDGIGNGGYEIVGICDDSERCWDVVWNEFSEYINRFGGFDDEKKVEINVGNGIEIDDECEWVILEYKERKDESM